jgi:hypothetical protein
MPTKDPAAPSFKEKAKADFKDFLIIAFYLVLLFCALSTYTDLVLKKYEVSYLSYSFAIINALVIAKVILIGQMAHLGKRAEARPLYQSIFHKAFVYCLLVFAVHILEEFVKRLIHGKPFGTVLYEPDYNELIARSIVIFFTFIPLFAFIELRRVLGEEELHTLLFHPRHP